MKTISLALIVLSISQVTLAERYLVTFKNQQIHQQLVARDKKDSTMLMNAQLQSYINSQGYALTADRIESHLQTVNAMVVKDLSANEAESLQGNQDVLFVEKEFKHPLPFPLGLFKKQILNQPTFKFFEQDMPWGITATHSTQTWDITSGGRGARVLVLDTGIDRDHPSVRPNLVNAKDFVGDEQEGYPYKDTVGHGTHVAGTIAGVLDKSGFAGVAPQASILAGRVCAEDGCSNIAIVEGINWGVEQKVDVISMSLGGIYSSTAERLAIRKAYQKGITIVAASGNDGTPSVGYPAALPEAIAVGAIGPDMKRAEFSQFGPELAIVAPGVDVTSSVPLGSGRDAMVNVSESGARFQTVKSSILSGSKTLLKPVEAEVVVAGLGLPADFEKLDVRGKIALIKRGENKFSEKVANAIKAQASGVIIYNNVPGMMQGMLTDDGSEVAIGAFMVEQSSGESWAKLIQAGKKVRTQIATAITNYSGMSGTSMATPHISGIVALMKSANPNLTPAQVKAILVSTANKLPEYKNNEVGAGVAQADLAVQAAIDLGKGIPLVAVDVPSPFKP